MVQRIPVRVRRVVDGVLYDSETASTIHYWDESFLLLTVRYVLGKTPGGQYFLASIHEGSILRPGPRIRVTPFDREVSIALLADVGAPDSVLEGLGVEMITPEVPDEPFHLPATETVLTSTKWFGWQALVKSDRGRFWMVRRYGLFGWKRIRVRPVSQRKAIYWALMNGVGIYDDRMALLGIRDPMEETSA